MYCAILSILGRFQIFPNKVEGEEKGKGPWDSWYIVNWSYGHRFIFFPRRDHSLQKESFQDPKKKQENYQESFLAGVGYRVNCLRDRALLGRMTSA